MRAAFALVPAAALLLGLAACDRGGTSTTVDPDEAPTNSAAATAATTGAPGTNTTQYQDGVYYDSASGVAAGTAGATGQTGSAVTPPVTATLGEGTTTPMDQANAANGQGGAAAGARQGTAPPAQPNQR